MGPAWLQSDRISGRPKRAPQHLCLRYASKVWAMLRSGYEREADAESRSSLLPHLFELSSNLFDKTGDEISSQATFAGAGTDLLVLDRPHDRHGEDGRRHKAPPRSAPAPHRTCPPAWASSRGPRRTGRPRVGARRSPPCPARSPRSARLALQVERAVEPRHRRGRPGSRARATRGRAPRSSRRTAPGP